MNINYDRGVQKRKHTASGVDVYMYFDEPGVYRNAYGHPVSEVLAKQAGFDTETLTKERIKRERMASAMAAIEAELGSDAQKATLDVVLERGGYKVVHIGLGRHNVLDPDGNKLNSIQLPEQEAIKLVEHLAPDAESVRPTTTGAKDAA